MKPRLKPLNLKFQKSMIRTWVKRGKRVVLGRKVYFWSLLFLLGQWLNFKLFGITYLVGKIKFKLFFSGSIG